MSVSPGVSAPCNLPRSSLAFPLLHVMWLNQYVSGKTDNNYSKCTIQKKKKTFWDSSVWKTDREDGRREIAACRVARLPQQNHISIMEAEWTIIANGGKKRMKEENPLETSGLNDFSGVILRVSVSVSNSSRGRSEISDWSRSADTWKNLLG